MATWRENGRRGHSRVLLILLSIAIAAVSGCGLPCKERLEANRRLFEEKCAKSFAGLKQSDSCPDACGVQSTVPQDKCWERVTPANSSWKASHIWSKRAARAARLAAADTAIPGENGAMRF